MTRMFDRCDAPAIPTLTCPYPVRLSACYSEIWHEWHEWFLASGRFATTGQRRRVVATDYPRLGAAAWPACDRQRLWDITTICAVNIEMDDDYDANRSGFGDTELRRRMQQAQGAEFRTGRPQGHAEPRWGPLFAQVWESFVQYVQPGVLQRMAEDYADYITGCGAMDDYLATHGEFIDIPTYMDLRYHSLGQRMDHRFTEISLGIDLTDIIDDPALVAVVDSEMRRTIIRRTCCPFARTSAPVVTSWKTSSR